jgi:N-succinyldiaminopimelate aminotransferase
VVTDEVYEHLVFEHLVFDGEHVPIAGFPGMRERTARISSAGKTFAFTGWKIGWVQAAPELVTGVKTAKQFLTFVSGGPFQYAIAQALALPERAGVVAIPQPCSTTTPSRPGPRSGSPSVNSRRS